MNFLDELKILEADGKITLRPNEMGDLLIANYTPKVQYEGLWTDTIKMCRGLIVTSDTGRIVARPFKKFFNMEEYAQIPKSHEYNVYEKVDGSLGICFYWKGKWQIATRGSFNSEQAVEANRIFSRVDYSWKKDLNAIYTYLFEIIYPENRIVVNYYGDRKLVLLAAINRENGRELDINRSTWPNVVKKYDVNHSLHTLKEKQVHNHEGYVVHWPTIGLRVKIKFEEYVRLHRILTNISEKTIWENLKEGRSVKELDIPDEFYNEIQKMENGFIERFDNIMFQANSLFYYIKELDRKNFASVAKRFTWPQVLFAMLDGRETDEIVWKILKPKSNENNIH